MKVNLIWIVAAAGLAFTAGCERAESPAEAQQDVADARAQGEREIGEAQQEAREDMADVQRDASDMDATQGEAQGDQTFGEDARETAADSSYKVAIAEAEATHRVEMEKCDAMTGQARDDCKERADAELERAKRDAEMRRDATG